MFTAKTRTKDTVVLVYVDDIDFMKNVKLYLHKRFEIVRYFLGIKMARSVKRAFLFYVIESMHLISGKNRDTRC